MSEVQMNKLPIPLANYVHLIKYRKSPYYDIIQYLLKEMEMHYERTERNSEVIYTINPRVLQEEIEKKVASEKLTTVNVCRTILAFLYGSKLKKDKDFYITTTSGGRKNYHIRINNNTLTMMRGFI